ncbi:NADP-dependent oxidoreductase domain-containing protein [Dichomitus squalens]|nr:NADP-dependent oxidoreductase domain-containing protein [Dichomitus squalens]
MTSPATRKLGNADALEAVLENGYIHIDTADAYNDNERLIGKWLQKSGRRKDIFLATQFGFAIDGKPFPDRRIYVAKAIDRSLQQLGTDYVDLWYLNRGEYSPFSLDIEDEKYGAILKTARELGVNRGQVQLACCYLPEDDARRYLPRFSAENFPKVLQAVDVIKGIAAKHGATPGQVTLTWLLAQGDDILAIPGSRNPANIKENIGAVDVKLTAEEVDLIRKAAVNADQADVPRYPPAFQALLMVDTPSLG